MFPNVTDIFEVFRICKIVVSLLTKYMKLLNFYIYFALHDISSGKWIHLTHSPVTPTKEVSTQKVSYIINFFLMSNDFSNEKNF